MSAVQALRAFVTERLTAAAEEIVGAFEKTMVEFEEELDRQRRMLDVVWRPEVKLHRIVVPEQQVSNEEEVVVTVQELCDQSKNFILCPEGSDPPEVKEEQEELVVKNETDDVTLIPPCEESDHNKPEPISSNSPVTPTPETHSETPTDKNTLKCGTFKYNSIFLRQLRSHTGEKPHACDSCGKRFSALSSLNVHLRFHRPERSLKNLKTERNKKPFLCLICEKRFTYLSQFKIHSRIHMTERLFSCQICKRSFKSRFGLAEHVRRSHTGQLPYVCITCGKSFLKNIELVRHIRVHTGERPYVCHICGKTFKQPGVLTNHLKIHVHAKDAAEMLTPH